MPTIELSAAAVAYGKQRGIPVVLDIRDLWPDIFLETVPPSLRQVARLPLMPLFNALQKAARDATALYSITRPILNWALDYAGRSAKPADGVFPQAYQDEVPDAENLQAADTFWKQHGIGPNHPSFVACFFGYFGRQFELDTVMRAAASLAEKGSDIRFVLCGDGDRLTDYRRLAAGCDNIIFPGFVGRAAIWTLMRRSSVGLAPYKSDFPDSIPNKAVEYLSAGLPVVFSLNGVLRQLLEDHRCGLHYANGSSKELARILCSLRDSPSRLLQMSKQALRVFGENFVASRVYGKMAEQLEWIAGAHGDRMICPATFPHGQG